MKRVCYIVAIVCTLLCTMTFLQETVAQENTRTRTRVRPSEAQSSSALPELSIRAKSMNEDQTQQVDNAPWLREIYRRVNLKEEENTPLYYPVEPTGDRMNLFTLIFKLMLDNKIAVYEYLDGREVFTDQYKMNFQDKETLDRFRILYTEKKSGAVTKYAVEESDIPSADVLSYLVKEVWYFNPKNSTIDIKLLAICPIQVREGDYGDMSSVPMFWLPYEDIRPYISQKPVMTSNINNAMTYTLDDYFRKRMFKGEIIKTGNLLNHTLAQQFGEDPEALKHAQDSIESQLKFFEQELWVKKDTTQVTKEQKKAEKKSSSRALTTQKKEQAPKVKASKSSPSSSAPVRSVRRTK
ncbi:MAG: gliding motility protein GldN [Dysgonamonadaceae bacterium]|nr:gliding motility protein GldN [Dysgonamonadaceae bacterium]